MPRQVVGYIVDVWGIKIGVLRPDNQALVLLAVSATKATINCSPNIVHDK